jgi:hypothetical protein
VRPEEVNDLHGIAFRDALALNELSRSPEKSLTNTVSAWNLATRHIPGWRSRQDLQALTCMASPLHR